MLRVLLALEDYGEMIFLQILLSKLGCDVGTLKNPKALSDSIYKMNPEILVMTAKGKRVNGCELSANVKKTHAKTKVILLAPLQVRDRLTPMEIQHAEAVLETPVNPPAFIETLAKLSNMDSAALLEKYNRVKPQISKSAEVESAYITGPATAENKIDRGELIFTARAPQSKRYEKFLKLDKPPKQVFFSKNTIQDAVKEIRQAHEENKFLDDERQAFVKALFQKKA